MKDSASAAASTAGDGMNSSTKNEPTVDDVKPGTVTPQQRRDAEPLFEEEDAFFAKSARYNDGEMKSIERGEALRLRKIYADKGYRFVRGSVAMLFGLLGAHLIFKAVFYAAYLATTHDNRPQTMFEGISSDIWIALISAVTVNILAVFLFVIKNLFPARSDS